MLLTDYRSIELLTFISSWATLITVFNTDVNYIPSYNSSLSLSLSPLSASVDPYRYHNLVVEFQTIIEAKGALVSVPIWYLVAT